LSGALILAAGSSRRFGADKRRHLIRTAEEQTSVPMLCVTARRYLTEFSNTTVVLRPGDETLTQLLRAELPQLQLVTAADAHLGMGHSLAAGITAIRHWRYVFIGLGDMPYVETATLRRLRNAMESALAGDSEGAIVQPVCNGQPGHPVGFSNDFFSLLESLQGDEGARSVVMPAGERLHRVQVSDEGVLVDIDRPD